MSNGDAQQLVGRERQERELIADFQFESRRRVNSVVICLMNRRRKIAALLLSPLAGALYVVALLVIAFAGLAYAQLTGPKDGEPPIQNRYQIVAGAGNSAWRVDTATGTMHFCAGGLSGVTCVQAR